MVRRSGFLLCLCCLCLGSGCGDSRRAGATRLPGLDPAAAAALAEPHSPAATALLLAASTDRLPALREPLLAARLSGAEPAPAIAAAVDAIDGELADGRGLAGYRRESAWLTALPDSTLKRVLALRSEAETLFAAADGTADENLARLERLQATLMAHGDADGALRILGDLATLEQRQGHADRAEDRRRRWVHHARCQGNLDEHCRSYHQLLMGRMARGWSAAERDTLRDLCERATQAGLARSAATMFSMMAYDAYNAGQYFTARTLFQDGIELCTRLGEPTSSLPTMVFLTRMYAIFECWDQVATLAERADQLLTDAIGDREPTAKQRLTQVQLMNLRARRLAAGRRADEAQALFASTFALARALPFEEASFVGRQWVEAMIDLDRPELAAIARTATDSLAVSRDNPAYAARATWWQAWEDWRRGDVTAAIAHLDSFAAAAPGQPAHTEDLAFRTRALRVRLEAVRNRERAWLTLRDGWRALQERLLTRENGTEAYLDLSRNPHLRWAAGELADGDAELGYGLELLWREAMLARAVRLDGVDDLRDAARERAAAARSQLAGDGSMHLLYRIGGDGMTRWAADARGVSVETSAVPLDSLRARTSALLTALATDPGDPDAPLPAAMTAALSRLARDLLPAHLLEPGGAPRGLAVTGDGFLTQFPFASLNLGPVDRYQPLVATTAVRWCRHGLAPVRASGRETLQPVGEPTLNAATRRRFALSAGLPGARAELERVAARFPGRGTLRGAEATVASVRERWDDADVLYFVGHAITDVQVPFAVWLPLSAGQDVATYPGIGIQDILGQRFRRCRVVVLSGCATGRPYVDGLSMAPSLGDAFLDAGVDATIQTLWHVRDRSGLIAPERIIATWRDQKQELAAALAAEQRRMLAGARGPRHPFTWAAWTVETGGAGD